MPLSFFRAQFQEQAHCSSARRDPCYKSVHDGQEYTLTKYFEGWPFNKSETLPFWHVCEWNNIK
jgi:hypothetical protein